MKKSIRGRLEDNSPNPVDIYVGKRIKLRRKILHFTQQKLATKLGITYQQVQKYEQGTNRIGASRLWDIAQVLHTSMDYFFDNMDSNTANLSPRDKNNEEIFVPTNDDPMLKSETLALVAAYYKIKNREAAKHILRALQAFGKSVCADE